ncbi:MAG TPA: helix-turn-helix domain-containing protein [Anaerolineales bacterium]|nr:helix-turn-helix domain-containing protein [Anaerolineales bacterium]
MIDVSFGEWLKHRRRTRGWTQKELAIRLNCSISALRKLEAEDRRPSAQVVERLAEVFEIPQDARKAFLHFARGDWQAATQEVIKGMPLPVSHLDPRSTLPDFTLDVGRLPPENGLFSFTQASAPVSEKITLIRKALDLAGSVGDVRRQLESLWQLGWLDQANRFIYWERALTLCRSLGDTYELASGLSTLGFFLVLNGNLATAQKYLAESNTLYQQLHLKPVISHLLSAYGQMSLIRGDFKSARTYLQEHIRATLEIGSRHDYLWSYVRLGYVAFCEGSLEEARRIFAESVQEFKKDKNTIGIVFTLEGMAGLFTQVRDHWKAVRLIGWADSTREKISDQRPLLEQADVDKIISACVAGMGETAFSEAYEEGKKMSLDEAVTYALHPK